MRVERKIKASYNDTTIRVYQAYNHIIADECIRTGTFGSSFKLNRMTWVKPSFLWMMYRSGWAKKPDQERILAIDMTCEGFMDILDNCVLTSYDSNIYSTKEAWRKDLEKYECRCQWDPDKDIYLNKTDELAIQIGIKGSLVEKYVNDYIVSITDITELVHEYDLLIGGGKPYEVVLPQEKVFEVSETVKGRLGIS